MFVTLTAPGFGPVHTHRTGPLRPDASPADPAAHPGCARTASTCPAGARHRDDRRLSRATAVPGLLRPRRPGRLEPARRRTVAAHHHRHHPTHHPQRPAARRRPGPDPDLLRQGRRDATPRRRALPRRHPPRRPRPRPSGRVLPAPTGLDIHDLADAVSHAATITRFTTDPHPTKPGGWSIAWGARLDVRPITSGVDGDITDGKVAGYLAKYATKATETTGHTSARITPDTIDIYADPAGSHPERLIDACWTLGDRPDWHGLRRWAHMLGFGGHFLTKSRRYSITFRLLRDERAIWQRTHTHADADDPSTTILVGYLTYVGAGWHTTGDALLADTAAATARERRQAARDELTQHHDAYASNHHTIGRQHDQPQHHNRCLLDIDQAAHRLGTQPRFMRRLVAERRIRFYKIGKHVRFHPDDLTDYINQGRVDAIRPDQRGTRAYA